MTVSAIAFECIQDDRIARTEELHEDIISG
jgi:hypothetical protein